MNKTMLTVGIALASLLAAPAFAQSKGEADESQSRAIPYKPATAAEKASAKASRRAEGSAVAKEMKVSDEPSTSASPARTFTAAQKKDAALKRRAATADALKKGQIPSGEK